jgi:hypothetical protein
MNQTVRTTRMQLNVVKRLAMKRDWTQPPFAHEMAGRAVNAPADSTPQGYSTYEGTNLGGR